MLLTALKKAVDTRNSVLNGAVVTAHGLMNAGTTHSGWLNTQLEWLRKASNWARFSAVVSAGVIHRGHLANAMRVLQQYLPREGQPTESPYAEGGGLFALGLIHAGRGVSASVGIHARPGAVVGGEDSASPAPEGGEAGPLSGVIGYLSNALTNTMDETVQHGACLGLGLAALGTGHDTLYSTVRNVLLNDKAVAGEAAGISIGLLLLGKGPAWKSTMMDVNAATEMLGEWRSAARATRQPRASRLRRTPHPSEACVQSPHRAHTHTRPTRPAGSAHATSHEKIVRGIGMGLALMCYGLEDGADGVIRQLGEDKDGVLRYGGMYALGLAYCGTANNAALKRLLHVAVSDVSDDVR